jgi:hypothetical protein
MAVMDSSVRRIVAAFHNEDVDPNERDPIVDGDQWRRAARSRLFLFIPLPMSSRVLVHPIWLFPNHTAAPRHLAPRPGFVIVTRLRTIAEGLISISFLVRFPVIHDNLYRHPAPPDAGFTLALIRAG